MSSFEIDDVKIDNWQPPGDQWWDAVKQQPDEPLIEATIKVTLSWNEYEELLRKTTR